MANPFALKSAASTLAVVTASVVVGMGVGHYDLVPDEYYPSFETNEGKVQVEEVTQSEE